MSFDRELVQEPLDRVGDNVSPTRWLLAPAFAPTLVRESTPATVIAIPTLVLQDSRTNIKRDFPAESKEAKTYSDNRESIVRINTTDVSVRGAESSTGTGFIVNQDGLIATGYHVVKDATTIRVRMENGKVYTAKLHDIDPSKDLALLQIQKQSPVEQFKPAQLASSSTDVKQGNRMIALGYPHNVDDVHLSGLTTNSRAVFSKLKINGGALPGEDPNRVVISSEGNVAKGNSGGPVLDPSTGKVVGIVNLSNEVSTYFNPIEDLNDFLTKSRNQKSRPLLMAFPLTLTPDKPSSLITSGFPAILPGGRLPTAGDFWKPAPIKTDSLPTLAPTVNPFYQPPLPSTKTPEAPQSTAPSLNTRIQELGRR